jgi:hypothetical protein
VVVVADTILEQAETVVQAVVVVKIIRVLLLGEQEQLVKAKTVASVASVQVVAEVVPVLWVKMFLAQARAGPVVRELQAQ